MSDDATDPTHLRYGLKADVLLYLEREYFQPLRARVNKLETQVAELQRENDQQFKMLGTTRAQLNKVDGRTGGSEEGESHRGLTRGQKAGAAGSAVTAGGLTIYFFDAVERWVLALLESGVTP